MACPPSAMACAIATVPDTRWWLSMLQVFVPVASALGLALLGYHFTLKSDLRAKGTEARLSIQRQALEDAQQELAAFWSSAMRLLRVPYSERLGQQDLLTRAAEASAAVTVSYSRLQDRQLADDMAGWHWATSQKLQAPGALSQEEVSAEHAKFTALSNRLGTCLRELTATEVKAAALPPERQAPVAGNVGETAAD